MLGRGDDTDGEEGAPRPDRLATAPVGNAGVRTVKPRWLGRLRGGRGGFMVEGDGGADCSSLAAEAVLIRNAGGGSGRVGAAMFNDRFLVLRGLLAGETGPFGPNKGLRGGGDNVGASTARCRGIGTVLARTGPKGMAGGGDSGEEPGDESVTDGESTVETVVVGEESVEADEPDEAEVETLPCA